MNEDKLRDWMRARPKPRAIICDIDDTICTAFDCPIADAVRVLVALDRSIEVHYVTARPEVSRAGTEQFLADHRLPGWRNVHLCPTWKSSRQHKTDIIGRLAREYEVLLSIGDNQDEEEASRLAGVPFVRVNGDDPAVAWQEAARLVATAPPEKSAQG